MSESEPHVIRSNDRVGLVGKTGAGKSAAAKRLVWEPLEHVVYYDMTGEEEAALNAPTLWTLEEVQEALFPEDPAETVSRFVYSPEVPTLEGFEELCRLCYEFENIHLIADELMLVYRSGNSVKPTTDHHLKILTNGRKKGVGMTSATQRPVNVPLETLSESEHQLVFKLKLPKDRDRMARIMGPAVDDATDLSPYWFYYDHDALEEPQLCQPLEL